MTTDEHVLPDALQPQTYDRQHGRPETYWTERNALVDAVHLAGSHAPRTSDGGRDWHQFSAWLQTEQGRLYGAALDALYAFDGAHGGTPIL